jgi:SH3-like domain-containing protein
MSVDNSLKNWQVEEGGKGADRYALSGTQTEAPKQLQLQEDASGGAQWQPIDYRRQTGPRRNWILPSVVIVALLGVLSYVGWIAFGQVVGSGSGSNPFAAMAAALSDVVGGQAATAPTPAAVAAAATLTETVAVEEPTATVAVTATPMQEPTATPTPEPPPPAQVELITGIVTEAAGVNARREPATTAEVVRLLAQNAAVTVVAEQDGWLQVILDDNTVAWVSADFIERSVEVVLLERLNEVLAAAGLPPVAVQVPTAAVTAAESSGLGATLPAVVIGEPGINARNIPDLVSGASMMLLPKDTAVTAVGRNGDNQWLAVALSDGGYGWVLTQFVSVQGDIATLNVVTPEQLAAGATATAAPEIESAPLALAPTATSSAPALPVLAISPVTPPAPFTNTLPLGAAVAISNLLGVNARATPSADGALVIIVPNGAVLPAVGRSADDQWIQVRLPDNQLAWMARTVINVSDNIDTAPVGGVDAAAASDAAPTADATATPGALPPGPPADAAIATITNQLGANLRSVPDRNANPVITVDNGERFPAIGRTAEGDWVQLALPDGTTAWALLGTISLDTDVNDLPIIP